MARISSVDPATATGTVKGQFDAVKGALGLVPNIVKVLGNAPAALGGYLGFSGAVGKESAFTAAEREAIALAVAGANACDYCASAHSAISANLKVPADEIQARLAGKSADPRLAATLTFARRIVETRGRVADADLAAARAAGLDEKAIVEVVANVALNLFTNYINHVAETDIDFPVVTTGDHAIAA